jgi:plasmid stabilization system protein ParE
MPESKPFTVLWTERASENAISIKKYLLSEFSEKEVNNFFALLETFETAISIFPKLYPLSSTKQKIRRAVLSKTLCSFYRISKSSVEILAILDNRCDLKEWY